MGQHLFKAPSGFQYGVEHENLQNYILKHFACTVTFFGFLLLLSWYYGRSDFERWDPVRAANGERDAAIEQRDDAQRTWQKTESKYEKTLATNLQLRSEISKASKDLPWLEQRVSALVEETNIQHNAIEGLQAIKRKYDKLSKQVNDYGLLAEGPEYRKRYEEAKRNLEFTKKSLQNSQYYAKGLEEKLQTQLEKPSAEIKWLRARLRRNARSTGDPEYKRVRCACTEPDIGYSLRDQGPRINTAKIEFRAKAEEESTAKDTVIKELREEVTARNQTIKGLQDTISDLNHTLSEGRKDLADARQERADIQRELGQHKAMVEELRNEIGQLESASSEMAEQPNLEAAENIRLLTIANTNLNELRRKNAEFQEQSETQTAKIGEWEAAGREFDARVEAKEDRIAQLEKKINEQSETYTTKLGEWEAAGREFNVRSEAKDQRLAEIEEQIRSYNGAIYKKDKDYKELYDHYYIVLGEKKDAIDKYNGDVKTFNTMQKGYVDRANELQRQHVNCGGQITTLTKDIRVLQGQLADLRTKFQQAKNETNPLREMLLKEREVAVKAKEDALKKSTDPMEHDQQGSNAGGLEMEDLERRLAAANQEINNAKNRNRAISGQLITEKKERSAEKARHEKLLKQEQENAKTKCDVLRITLEKENPLKRIVSKLQDEVIRLRGEVEKRK